MTYYSNEQNNAIGVFGLRVVKKKQQINKKITKKKLDVVSRTFILDAISISLKISNLQCEKKKWTEQNGRK